MLANAFQMKRKKDNFVILKIVEYQNTCVWIQIEEIKGL